MKQQILVDIGGTLTLKAFENGIQVIPTSAKITIYDNQGAEKVAQTTATVDASGTMTYSVASSIVDSVDRNWKVIWEYVVGGVTLYQSQLFDIVNNTLVNNCITDDIVKRGPFLKKLNFNKIFQADATSTNATIVSTELNEEDDHWTNGTAIVTAGTNKDEERKVVSFSAQTLTVSPVFTSAIDSTSVVKVVRSYEKEIDEAWAIFLNDLMNRGLYSDLIIGSDQVKEFIINKTLEIICFNFSNDNVDIWFTRYQEYKTNYDNLFGSMRLDYDKSNDGNIDEPDESGSSFYQGGGVR